MSSSAHSVPMGCDRTDWPLSNASVVVLSEGCRAGRSGGLEVVQDVRIARPQVERKNSYGAAYVQASPPSACDVVHSSGGDGAFSVGKGPGSCQELPSLGAGTTKCLILKYPSCVSGLDHA